MMLPLWWRWVAYAALVAGIWGHGWVSGAGHVERRLEALRAANEAVYLAGVERAAKIADHVVYHYVDRWHTLTERGRTIIREIPRYVTIQADIHCAIPVGFVRLHNAAAAADLLPAAAGDLDAPAAGVALSTVAATVADNYATCHATREKLIALQAWASAR